MSRVRGPARVPCPSCPYRKDVPSGVWSRDEYLKLPEFDLPTAEQPPGVFMCHQQNGRLCAGWVGCHDMDENFGLRLHAESMDELEVQRTVEYECPVELFDSGADAAAHGLRDLLNPGPEARKLIEKLVGKKGREFG